MDDQDIALVAQYQREQLANQESIRKLEGMMFILARTVERMVGSDKFWVNEAKRNIKYATLNLLAACSAEPTAQTLAELKKIKAENDAAKAIANDPAPNVDITPPVVKDAAPELGGELEGKPQDLENLPVQDKPAEGQAVSE